jgi:hypothetical protein
MQPSQQKRRRLDDKELVAELAATHKLGSASSTGKENLNSSRSQQPQGDVGLYSPLPRVVIEGQGGSKTKQVFKSSPEAI